MARPQSEDRAKVFAALKVAYAITDETQRKDAIAGVVAQFPNVPLRTMQSWIKSYSSSGDDIQRKVADAIKKVAAAATGKTPKPGTAVEPVTPAQTSRRKRAAGPEMPPGQTFVPGDGDLDAEPDGWTRRFVEGRLEAATPENLLQSLAELLRDATALRECSIRKVGEHGHVITDPLAFAQSVSLSKQIVEAQAKLVKESFSQAQMQSILAAIVKRIRARDKALAAVVAQDIIEVVRLQRADLVL